MKMKATATMMNLVIVCIVKSTLAATVERDEVNCEPLQVRLSYGDAADQIHIVWATRSPCDTTEVAYGLSPWHLEDKVTGARVNISGPHNLHGMQQLHRAMLTGLQERMTYYYRPISNRIASGPFYFQSPPIDTDWSPEVLVSGDLGEERQLLPLLAKRALSGQYSATLQLGALSSYLQDDNGTTGDQLLQGLEQTTAFLPFMTAAGNYEREDDEYHNYRHRFSMPGSVWPSPPDTLWYSFDLGPVHFVSVCTTIYLHENTPLQQKQHDWLIKDLTEANRERSKRPWIVVFGRNPLYCASGRDDMDCSHELSLVRSGLEDIFYTHGVDLILQSHSQSYQRLYPVFKGVAFSTNFTNPQAPVHIIIGSTTTNTTTTNTATTDASAAAAAASPASSPTADVSGTDPLSKNIGAVDGDNGTVEGGNSTDVHGARNGSDSGNDTETIIAVQMMHGTEPTIGSLHVINATHAHWRLWSGNAETEGDILDTLWLVQDSHGPFHLSDLPTEVENKIEPQLDTNENTKPDILQSNSNPQNHSQPLGDLISIVTSHRHLFLGISFGVAALLVAMLILACRLRRRQRGERRGLVARRWDSMDYKYGKTKLSNEVDDYDNDDDLKEYVDELPNVDDERSQTMRLIK